MHAYLLSARRVSTSERSGAPGRWINMQFPRPRRQRSDEDDRILPLTNIIFLLLIFFMLVGHLSNPNTFTITPPRSISDNATMASSLLVQVNAHGKIAVDGEPVAPATLESRVADYLDAHERSGGIRLKADGLVDAARIVAVMRVLRKAGADTVRLMTIPTER